MFRLGKIFGIDVFLNWTTLILAFLLTNWFSDSYMRMVPDAHPVVATMAALVTGLGFLASILAHEFGHALTGRRFGVGCRSIMLHIFGGIAGLDGHPPTAKSEFWIAIAGPAVSFALGVGLLILSIFSLLLFGEGLLSVGLVSLGYINLVLGAFNLVPAFPMDGGRVLRAGVWHKTKDFIKSTKIAVHTGKVFGGLAIGAAVLMSLGIYIPFFGVGLFNGIWLGLLAALIMWMGEQELKQARMRRMY